MNKEDNYSFRKYDGFRVCRWCLFCDFFAECSILDNLVYCRLDEGKNVCCDNPYEICKGFEASEGV